ncbi:hypothetical protein Y032_0154g3018 [Ancylostoma ceylanicum]|uniref:Peptidase C1A papain C-terminal domain-containing protein n=2 Tax=Ancylostoma ceylanicum TaxID=53326 RepID=A0A016T0I7_9BILA|nr:hypothetical protein Y032_0154g3018 [Ancylostoma ceylanicum]
MWILFVLVVTAFAAKPTTIEEFLARPKTEPAQPLTGQALVDYVNEQQSFFQAEYNQQAEELAKFRLMEPEFLVKPKKEEVLSDVYGDEPPESLQLLKKILASGIHARLLRHAAPPALSYVLRHGSVDAQASTPATIGKIANRSALFVTSQLAVCQTKSTSSSKFMLGSFVSGSYVGSTVCAVERQDKVEGEDTLGMPPYQNRQRNSCLFGFNRIGSSEDQESIRQNTAAKCLISGLAKVLISDTDILSCCNTCGYGCRGGWMKRAYDWMESTGVVTGGHFRQRGVCRPYAFYPCGHHEDQKYYGPCPQGSWPTPRCRKTCQRGYNKSYADDKYFATKSYYLPKDEKKIRQEIYKNGPVVAGFDVYTDFLHYKKGIYVHTSGYKSGAHAVKVIGWGRENGTDYWLIANSWNSDWGDNGMYFSISSLYSNFKPPRVIAFRLLPHTSWKEPLWYRRIDGWRTHESIKCSITTYFIRARK